MLPSVELPDSDARRSTIVINFEMSNVSVSWLPASDTVVFILPMFIFPAALNLNTSIPFSVPCAIEPDREPRLSFIVNVLSLATVNTRFSSPARW